MNKKAIIFSLFIFALTARPAYAITITATDSSRPQILKERMQNIKTRIVAQKENREDYYILLQQKRDASRTDVQAKREEFKTKLAELKDQRKKTIVERVDLKLSAINISATDRMNEAIEKLEKLLDKFIARAQTAKAEGQNTTEVDAAITAAENAINTAKEAVAAQAAKEYKAEISNEPTLKNTVGAAVSSLRKDLQATHHVVKDAKQKVIDVARALAKLHSVNATPTPSI